jgi:hypothetical protein
MTKEPKLTSNSTTFYCFSPAVMLATFIIEAAFALYAIWRYKMTTTTRLVVAILACLATFQAAEYMICGGIGIQAGTWSRLGYSAITLLPPLGIHLVLTIAKKRNPILLTAAYSSAVAFVAFYAFATMGISGHTCYANYAVFDVHAASSLPYGLYYYGWLFVGVGLALNYASKMSKYAKALRSLAVGYSAFIIPTAAVNLIDPSTISGIPSIMCGFAVILAFILVGRVAPESIALKESAQPLRFKLPF